MHACVRATRARRAQWAEQTIALAPFRETGYRRLMEAHVAAGNRAEALRVYERCRRLLADELGAYPSPETESIYRELARGAPPPRPTATSAPRARPPAGASVCDPERDGPVVARGLHSRTESRSRTSGDASRGAGAVRLARGGRAARRGDRRRRRRLDPRRRPRRRRRVARRAGRPRLGRLCRSRLEPAGGRYPARRDSVGSSPQARARLGDRTPTTTRSTASTPRHTRFGRRAGRKRPERDRVR